MITLQPVTDTTFKVVIQKNSITEEEYTKLIRERDRLPNDFIRRIIPLIPEGKQFYSYEHLEMLLTVNG
jgi:hypothetical protein